LAKAGKKVKSTQTLTNPYLFLFPLRQLQCSMQHALAKAGKKVARAHTLTNRLLLFEPLVQFSV
jgi:hypothetical protein